MQGSCDRICLFMYSHKVGACLIDAKIKFAWETHRHVYLSLNDYTNTNG